MDGTPRRFVREECGQELIEFAIAALVFLMTVFGTLEFGLAVWQYNMVSDLAQEGARWASVRGRTSTLGNATRGMVETYVQTRSSGGFSPSVTSMTPDPVGYPGSTIAVTVTVSFAPLTQLSP
jgi:Flp pilus assembly protein TadG